MCVARDAIASTRLATASAARAPASDGALLSFHGWGLNATQDEKCAQRETCLENRTHGFNSIDEVNERAHARAGSTIHLQAIDHDLRVFKGLDCIRDDDSPPGVDGSDEPPGPAGPGEAESQLLLSPLETVTAHGISISAGRAEGLGSVLRGREQHNRKHVPCHPRHGHG